MDISRNKIEVCMGKGCAIKGAGQVLALIEKEKSNSALVKSATCMGSCEQGICVRLNGARIVKEVTPANCIQKIDAPHENDESQGVLDESEFDRLLEQLY